MEASIAIFEGVGLPHRIMSVPLPMKLNKREVLVKNSYATICGSDLHTWRGLREAATPLVLGHEGMGRILQLGSETNPRWKVGQRITWSIFGRCGVCLPCTDFQVPQKCDHLFKYGHTSLNKGNGLDGCYSSHTLLRNGTHIALLPDNIPDKLAAPLNCAFSTMHAALDPKKLPSRINNALIQGAGLLGLYACLILNHIFKAKQVFVVDKNPYRLALIKKFGGIPLPSYSTNPKEFDATLIKEKTSHGVDVVVETCGDVNVVKQGIDLLRFGGHFVMVGLVHPQSKLSDVTGYQIIHKCASLHGTHNYGPNHLDEAINFLSSVMDQYPFEELISSPFSLKDMDKAFEEATTQKWLRVCVKLDE